MEQYRVPSLITPKNVLLHPASGAACLVALVILVIRFGGWPSTPIDASFFLAIFNLVAALVTIFVVTEAEDWQEDVRHGTRPFERVWLVGLLVFHGIFSLAVTVAGSIVMRVFGHAEVILAGAVFLAGTCTLSVMLLGRK